MNTTTDQRKLASGRLANYLFAGHQDSEVIRELITQLNEGAEEHPVAVDTSTVTDRSVTDDHIGIWLPKEENGQLIYERDKNLVPSWRRWSVNQHTILPKGSQKRVVLLGESVARGYFYDPFYNNAMELQALLQSVQGLEDAEVVDLAKNGLQLNELWDLSSSCMKLDPDALVIFAGNNWLYSLYNADVFTDEEMSALKKAHTVSDMSAIQVLLERKIYELVRLMIAHLGELGARHNIEIVVIIPEFNLADWKSNHLERMVLFQSENVAVKWMNARRNAERFFSSGQFDKAEKETATMLALDPSNPLGYEMAAECKLKKGAVKQARELLEQARDAAIISKIWNYAPRCNGSSRRAILDEAAKHAISVVDLPEVFLQQNPESIPNREFFMDYCHLTVKGIKLAMEATAQVLVTALTGKTLSGRLVSSVLPDSNAVAMAHVFAAIQCSGYQQPEEILKHHCVESLKASNVAHRFMGLFVSMTTRRASSVLTRNYEEMILKNMVDQYLMGLGLLHSPNKKMLNIQLVNSMVEALQMAGIDMRLQLERLFEKEHAVENCKVNLLESYYHQRCHVDINFEPASHFKARDMVSDFTLVTRKESPIRLKLVCRLSCPLEAEVTIRLNDQPIASFMAGEHWRTFEVTIPVDAQRPTLNNLSIEWPADHPYLKARTQEGIEKAGENAPAINVMNSKLYPLFGEIHMLTAEKYN